MDKKCKYDNFPVSTVIIRSVIASIWLFSSAMLMFQANLVLGVLYSVYAVILLLLILKTACSRCDYYGFRCDTGLGKVAAFLFIRKNNRNHFSCIAKGTLIPLLILAVLPPFVFMIEVFSAISVLSIVFGIVFIITLGLLIYTNRTLSCPHCKMNDICPLGKNFS